MAEKVMVDHDFEENFVESETVPDSNVQDLSENGKDDHDTIKPSSKRDPIEPCKGMIFDDLEDAMACYKAFARKKGFSIRKNHTRRSHIDNLLIGVEITCHREGYRRPSYYKKHKNVANRSETMIGCKAMMSLIRDSERWIGFPPRGVGIPPPLSPPPFPSFSTSAHLPLLRLASSWILDLPPSLFRCCWCSVEAPAVVSPVYDGEHGGVFSSAASARAVVVLVAAKS
ncbi:hypothetical protein RHGRI_013762 [Rhododendron griersonianum]|uniref:FAR1 domain-containing protein n=1 Tax=Rhododendron griersonianum TaxID=479676 RepID=A0AAV6K734_9ERIC|nr:hypothetical protein RHGRI_013762 [Rhododendron griersonianum]